MKYKCTLWNRLKLMVHCVFHFHRVGYWEIWEEGKLVSGEIGCYTCEEIKKYCDEIATDKIMVCPVSNKYYDECKNCSHAVPHTEIDNCNNRVCENSGGEPMSCKDTGNRQFNIYKELMKGDEK